MAAAEVLFLSDEGAGDNPRGLMAALAERYGNRVVAMGRGAKGALLLHEGRFTELPAWDVGGVRNTVGAGDALFAAFCTITRGGWRRRRLWTGRSWRRR